MTDIESLAKELWEVSHGWDFNTIKPEHKEDWHTLAAHVLKREAAAELRGLVAACNAVCPMCRSLNDRSEWGDTCHIEHMPCAPIRRLIAAHHAKHKPKPPCEHKAGCGIEGAGDGTEVYTCSECKATRTRGWTSDWKEPGK